MKKITLLFVLFISISGWGFSQIAPAGTPIWNDDISNATITNWSINNTGDGIVEMASTAIADTTWSDDGNGYLHVSSNGAGGASSDQTVSIALNTPLTLPSEGKEHLALVFEQYYTKKNSQTFIEYSKDGMSWQTIEINKHVAEDSTIRRFVPMRIPVDTGYTQLHVRFSYQAIPDATLNSEWIIDNLKVVQLPVVKIVPDKTGDVCDGDSVVLTPTLLNSNTGATSLKWDADGSDASQPLIVKSPGSVKLNGNLAFPGSNPASLSNTLESVGDSVNIDFKFVYEDEEVFLATVEPESGKNLVCWKKTEGEGTAFFRLYKGPTNNETYVGQVPFDDLPVFIDPSSNPKLRSDRYKITVVDTCGNESFYSETHATIHLGLTTLANDEIELNWSEYNGFAFNKYYIFKGNSSTNMVLIDSVDNTVTQYIDATPFADSSFYRIEIDKGEVYDPAGGKKSNSGPFSRSLSNIEDNRQQTTLLDKNTLSSSFNVYPNPFKGSTNISYQLPMNAFVQLDIINILGQKVHTLASTYQVKGDYTFDISNQDLSGNQGIYFLKLKIDKDTFVKKIIVR